LHSWTCAPTRSAGLRACSSSRKEERRAATREEQLGTEREERRGEEGRATMEVAAAAGRER